jgi:hypothetical protein
VVAVQLVEHLGDPAVGRERVEQLRGALAIGLRRELSLE